MREEVISAVASMAGSTAQESARLLANHFREADRAAEKAADRYDRACRSLGWRNWIWFLAAQGGMCLVAVVLIMTLIPSLDEIYARRNTLTQLQVEVEGYPLHWGNCSLPSSTLTTKPGTATPINPAAIPFSIWIAGIDTMPSPREATAARTGRMHRAAVMRVR